eukprot:2279640-Pyramimonas_sp.AAC.1
MLSCQTCVFSVRLARPMTWNDKMMLYPIGELICLYVRAAVHCGTSDVPACLGQAMMMMRSGLRSLRSVLST